MTHRSVFFWVGSSDGKFNRKDQFGPNSTNLRFPVSFVSVMWHSLLIGSPRKQHLPRGIMKNYPFWKELTVMQNYSTIK